jgi:hypothetical protein
MWTLRRFAVACVVVAALTYTALFFHIRAAREETSADIARVPVSAAFSAVSAQASSFKNTLARLVGSDDGVEDGVDADDAVGTEEKEATGHEESDSASLEGVLHNSAAGTTDHEAVEMQMDALMLTEQQPSLGGQESEPPSEPSIATASEQASGQIEEQINAKGDEQAGGQAEELVNVNGDEQEGEEQTGTPRTSEQPGEQAELESGERAPAEEAPRSRFAVVMFTCPGERWSHHCSSPGRMEAESILNKRLWACKHGYDLIVEGERSLPAQGMKKVWGKVSALQRHIADYEYLLWVDIDSVLLNPDISFEDLVRNFPSDLLIARDWNGINFGVAIMKNTPWMVSTLANLWDVPGAVGHVFQEQYALGQILDRLDGPSASQHVSYVPLRHFNSYPAWTPGIGGCGGGCIYAPGDFMIHFPGCGDQWGRNCDQEFHQMFRMQEHAYTGGMMCHPAHHFVDNRV